MSEKKGASGNSQRISAVATPAEAMMTRNSRTARCRRSRWRRARRARARWRTARPRARAEAYLLEGLSIARSGSLAGSPAAGLKSPLAGRCQDAGRRPVRAAAPSRAPCKVRWGNPVGSGARRPQAACAGRSAGYTQQQPGRRDRRASILVRGGTAWLKSRCRKQPLRRALGLDDGACPSSPASSTSSASWRCSASSPRTSPATSW